MSSVSELISEDRRPDSLDALDTSDSSRQIDAQQAAICSFVRKATHHSKTKVDGSSSEATGFQMHPIPGDNRLARQSNKPFAKRDSFSATAELVIVRSLDGSVVCSDQTSLPVSALSATSLPVIKLA